MVRMKKRKKNNKKLGKKLKKLMVSSFLVVTVTEVSEVKSELLNMPEKIRNPFSVFALVSKL